MNEEQRNTISQLVENATYNDGDRDVRAYNELTHFIEGMMNEEYERGVKDTKKDIAVWVDEEWWDGGEARFYGNESSYEKIRDLLEYLGHKI